MSLKFYVVSLGAGLLVGAIYGLMNVRSPAPPVIALVGLLGILIGEQAVPLVKRIVAREPVSIGWLTSRRGPALSGERPDAVASTKPDAASRRDI